MGWQCKVESHIFVAFRLVVVSFPTKSESRGDVKHILILKQRHLRCHSWMGSIDHISSELFAESSESNDMLHFLFLKVLRPRLVLSI